MVDTETPGTIALDPKGTVWQYRGREYGWYPAAPGLAPHPTLSDLINAVGEVRVIDTPSDE